jgi:hypothetical protein
MLDAEDSQEVRRSKPGTIAHLRVRRLAMANGTDGPDHRIAPTGQPVNR